MAKIFYAEVDDFLRKVDRYKILENANNIYNVDWKEITPDKNNNWLNEGMQEDWENFIQLGSKDSKSGKSGNTIFKLFSLGISTNRDSWVYNSNKSVLSENINRTAEFYNNQVSKYSRLNTRPSIDDFVDINESKISWSSTLKDNIKRSRFIDYDKKFIYKSLYRPFYKNYLYFDKIIIDRPGNFPKIFPTLESEKENLVICGNGISSEKPFSPFISNQIVNLAFLGGGTGYQCFPFYTYNEDGTNRRENISDWALEEFRKHYKGEEPHPNMEKQPHPNPLLKGEGARSPLPVGEDLGEGVSLAAEDLGEGVNPFVLGEGVSSLGEGVNLAGAFIGEHEGEKFHYNRSLVSRVLLERARDMRKKPTSAEDFMWQLLRDRQLNGLKFRRQHPVREFILDFYCHDAKLGIELDGGIHKTKEVKRNDEIRTSILLGKEIRIIRFTNDEVFEQTEKVLNKILEEANIEVKETRQITKWDIFYYIYGVLHKPEYRTKYAANLRRELPRIPFYGIRDLGLGIRDNSNGNINNNEEKINDKELSGFGSLEESNGIEHKSLQGNEEFSKGRGLLSDISDSEGSDFNSIEYCRRAFEKIKERIHSVLVDKQRLISRTGNTVDNINETGIYTKAGSVRNDERNGDNRENAFGSNESISQTQTPIPNPQPLIPLNDCDIFWYYSFAGRLLSELHVNYEEQPEYPLTKIEAPGKRLDLRVEKMKLSKDKQTIIYNDFLSLTGIPYEAFEYKLGNRSALDWLIDQYQIKTDKRSGIVNDPNRPDEPDYIIKLIGKIVTVSLETVKIVREL